MLPNIPRASTRLFAPRLKSRLARLRRSLRAQHGSALVEMALSMPLLLMIFVGIFSFSLVLYQKLQLAEAVSVGGRFLAVDRGDTDPCASTASKIYAAAPGLTQSKFTLNFTINGVATGASCPGTSGGANANMISGVNAQVTASYPCNFLFFPAFGATFSSSCALGTSVTELVQ